MKPLNIRTNEIMSASLVHKEAFRFFEKVLRINHNCGIENFLIKIPFVKDGQQVIGLINSELNDDKFIELYKNSNKTWKPLSIKRELLKWSFHKHLEEYETHTNESGIKQYIIPVKELSIVSTFIDEAIDDEESPFKEEFQKESKTTESSQTSLDENDDFFSGDKNLSMKDETTHVQNSLPIIEKKITEQKKVNTNSNKIDARIIDLTARDLFTIIHGKPVSNKDWLNQLVINNQK
jgi:hypothetical protein